MLLLVLIVLIFDMVGFCQYDLICAVNFCGNIVE